MPSERYSTQQRVPPRGRLRCTVNTMTAKTDVIDLQLVIENQKALYRRLLWLFLLPFMITAVFVVMFFRISDRLTDVELGTKLVTIERILDSDKNYAWAVDQYESLAGRYSNAQVFARLGTLYFLLSPKNKEVALRTLERARTIDPSYWEIYRSLTFVYLADQPKEAIEAGQMALKLNKNDANTYNNLAWIYSASNDPAIVNLQLAQEYAERAVKLTMEKQANFLDTLAGIYVRRGARDRALDSLRKAKVAALDQSGYVETIQAHLDLWFPNGTP